MVPPRLQQVIDTLGIDIQYEDLHSQNPNYDGYACPAQKLIVLDISIRGTRQELCVLSEETGHHVEQPGLHQKIYHSKEFWKLDHLMRGNVWALCAKDERRAVRWGTGIVIPDREFWDFAATGPHLMWEWCEHFGVEGWFMAAKMGYIRVREHELRRRVPRMREFILRL